jgi:ornithine cyclodeaminase/alanine dehydrogenase-like protein (mu-crystallin family)
MSAHLHEHTLVVTLNAKLFSYCEPSRLCMYAILAALRSSPSIGVWNSPLLRRSKRQREANLATRATTSTGPLACDEWLQHGAHLDLVSGFKRNIREVDDEAVRRARVGADTYAGALAEAGDHAQPIDRGVIDRAHVIAELAEVLRGEKQVRTSANDITLFKSVGTALEDLAAVRCALSA